MLTAIAKHKLARPVTRVISKSTGINRVIWARHIS